MTHGHPDRREAERIASQEPGGSLVWLVILIVVLCAVYGLAFGCRAPDGYGVQVEGSKAEGEYGRGNFEADRLSVAPYVEWDSGERRAARAEARDFKADALQEIMSLRHELALSRAAGGAVRPPRPRGSDDGGSASGGQGGAEEGATGLIGRIIAGDVTDEDLSRLATWSVALALLAVVAYLLRALGVPVPLLGKKKASGAPPDQE